MCVRPAEYRLQDRLDQYPGTPVLTAFPDDLQSRSRWYEKFDRRVRSHEKPKAIVAWEHQQYSWELTVEQLSGQEEWSRNKSTVITPVNLFSEDQTVPVAKSPRTKALEGLWEIFCAPSHHDFKILYLPDGPRTWRGKITKEDFRRHIRGIRDIAVRMGRFTNFIGLDHDLHDGDRAVFEQQLKILLDELWGKSTWHLQVKETAAKGVHFFCVLDQPQMTEKVVADLRSLLSRLDARHPELATQARRFNMKSFSAMEIKPTESVGLRLPLAAERTMLIDKPLRRQTYRGQEEPDLVTYHDWLTKAAAGIAPYMPKQEVFQFVSERLHSSTKHNRVNTSIIVPPGGDQPLPAAKEEGCESKKMKNCAWKQVTRAWSGHMEADSLNHWIRQLSLYAPFRFTGQSEAVQVIEKFIDDLPDHSFSDRLMAGERTKVSAIIEQNVAQAFDGWKAQPDAEKSAKKLRAAWERWASTGRDPFDKSTWDRADAITTYHDVELAQDFEWSPDEYEKIDQLAKLLNADLRAAASAAKYFIRLVMAHGEVPRTWVVALLCDCGIRSKSKKLGKPKVFINFLLDLNWVYVQAQHYTRRCRRFGVAELRYKFPSAGRPKNECDFLTCFEETDCGAGEVPRLTNTQHNSIHLLLSPL